jgi:excisionase family DNA binding protein
VAKALALLEYRRRDVTRAEEVAVLDRSMQQTAPNLAGLPNHLLTIPEVAEFLNVPVRWVQEAVQQRRVRCTRIGKHVRFTAEHLAELIASGEQGVLSAQAGAVTQFRDGRRSRL